MGIGPSTVHVLAFGDSLTEGYHDRGTDVHPYTRKLRNLLNSHHSPLNFEMHNHGVSGETTEMMLVRLSEVLSKKVRFSFAIVLGGTNDLQMGEPERSVKNLRRIHEAMMNRDITTIAITVPEMEAEKEYPEITDTRLAINERLRLFCHQKKIPVVDLAEKMPYWAISEKDRDFIWDDGLHFTPYGYDLMGEHVYDVIKKLI